MSEVAAPGSSRGRRRSRSRRVVIWVSVALALLVVAVAGTAVGLYYHYNGQLTRVGGVISGHNGPGTRADGSTAPVAAPAANYLIVGTDSRAGANGTLPHTGGSPCHCADTIIVAHLPKGHAKATLASIPRDSWVTIPSWTSPSGQHDASRESKINAALAIGGPGLLVKTVESLTGLRIDHYVQVNFMGFVDMVDAVHGVNVCLSAPTQDSHTGIDLTAGEHHLDGVHALEYVRQRHGLPAGDLDRIKRQQVVISQVVDRVLSAGILLHPGRLTSFLDVVTKSITVDSSLSFNDLRGLATTFRHLDAKHVRFATVPVATESGVRDGQSVVLLDMAKVDRMFNAIAKDERPRKHRASGASGASGSPSPSPSPSPSSAGGAPCIP
jgi:LCP family protein required for cell wall assembly